ncbi:MAG: restriction endonuclease subunit S, partial [Verrucomicrobia bacterium]|nr:restriction endonuclease subunit S [Verrucomicrobiota bacterium]
PPRDPVSSVGAKEGGELPTGWKLVRLGDIAQTTSGGTPRRDKPQYYGGTIPWVKSGELGDQVVYETRETLSDEGLASSNAKIFPKGTLCIALYGATVGKLGILGIDAATNQAVCAVFPREGLDTRYLYRFFEGKRRELIEQGKGGAQSNISQGIIRDTLLPVPPLPEQHRIVAEIEKQFTRLEAGVVALRRVQSNLKRYRAAVLKAACEGKLVPTEAELARVGRVPPRGVRPNAKNAASGDAAYSAAPFETGEQLLQRILAERRQNWQGRGKYKEPAAPDTTKLPPPPSGWTWVTPEQVSSSDAYALAIGPFGSNLKVSDYTEAGVPLVFVRNIRSSRFGGERSVFVSKSKAAELYPHQVRAGDILVTKMGEPPGDACLYPDSAPDAVITADCIKLHLTALLPQKRFFMHAVNSEVVKPQIQLITKGVAQMKVSLGRFSTLAIPLPPPSPSKRESWPKWSAA